MRNRAVGNIAFAIVTWGALSLSALLLIVLTGGIFSQGLKAISLSLWLMPASNFGASGGILYQIVGSLILVAAAAAIVLPVALGASVYRSEYLRHTRRAQIFDTALYILNGVPSIIFGLFGLIVFVNLLGMGISWLAGAIILAMMVLPTVTLASVQAMQSIPDIYRENGFALGLSRERVVRNVILPQSFHGAITGLLIGMARAIGETAPIMFVATAFSGVTVPRSIYEPVSSLPTHILALAQQATNPQALANAWGASFTLLMLVILFSSLAYVARRKFQLLTER